MSRYLTPLLFVGATAYMWHYNGTHDSSKLILPFLDVLFPEIAGDPAAMATRSFQVAVALTVVVTVMTVIGHIRALRYQAAVAALEADDDE